jgi:archaellum component FlaC
MPRVKEEPRGRLAALQEMLSDGSQVLLDQAQSLRDEVQRRIGDVASGLANGFEEQLGSVATSVEERLSRQIDDLLSGLAVSIRKDLDRLRERVRSLEMRMTDVPREGVRELVNPLQALANNAIQTAASVQTRIEELVGRVQTVERRAGELQREPAHDTLQADDLQQRLERLESRLNEIARDTGGKLGEVGAMRERLTRIENRVLETSKEQIARAGESTGLRDRLARLEARLSDLSREQVARAVEAAGLRERVFRLEQRTIAIDSTPSGWWPSAPSERPRGRRPDPAAPGQLRVPDHRSRERRGGDRRLRRSGRRFSTRSEAGRPADERPRDASPLRSRRRQLRSSWPGDQPPVYGSAGDAPKIPGITDRMHDGDRLTVGGLAARIIFIPAHTSGHVAYHFRRSAPSSPATRSSPPAAAACSKVTPRR